MTCSVCLPDTPELQTLDAHLVCPRCGTDYSAFRVTLPALTEVQRYNLNTRKMIPNGQAQRDRLLRARLALRSNQL